MSSREIFAIENRMDDLHTIRVNSFPANLLDLTREVPVILGWSNDSITIKIVPRTEAPEAPRLIDKVSETTRGRRGNYGRPLINFFRIASLWHDYLAGVGKLAPLQFISPEDVAFMMVLLKIARAEHSYADDNLLDGMGYLDCLDDMHRQMIELGYEDGLQALHTMSITEMGLLGGQITSK